MDTLPCIDHTGPRCADCGGTGLIEIPPFSPATPLPVRAAARVGVGRHLVSLGVAALIGLCGLVARLTEAGGDHDFFGLPDSGLTALVTAWMLVAGAGVVGGVWLMQLNSRITDHAERDTSFEGNRKGM